MVSPRKSLDWHQPPALCHGNSYASHPALQVRVEIQYDRFGIEDGCGQRRRQHQRRGGAGFGRIGGLCWSEQPTLINNNQPQHAWGAGVSTVFIARSRLAARWPENSDPSSARAQALTAAVAPATVIITTQIETRGDVRRGGSYVEWTVVTIFTSMGWSFI
jgi:hypothetical protein